ncbi:uncharacterized protein BXZ73DRAFT_90829 [Epithele typhae]|uniref:uncharacterized protein n=1 Tax=Epithele typhae TaxID=378194 RepID=UPI0020071F2C|nr:uncharacterized protein BXZ73DRAFT_90829 [Epithele typhae]KAH9927147.1 hypothetical protein BXZ73DRAFT_90829 [Epithele typhae]
MLFQESDDAPDVGAGGPRVCCSSVQRDQLDVDASIEQHDITTAPLFSREAFIASEILKRARNTECPQSKTQHSDPSGVHVPAEPRLYLNTNAPFSALVCGVQGAGKSHTVSVMLEGMLIPDCPSVGTCKRALAASSSTSARAGPARSRARPRGSRARRRPPRPGARATGARARVRVGAAGDGGGVRAAAGAVASVEPLRIAEAELDAQGILSMMAVGDSAQGAPLYMQTVLAFIERINEAMREMNPQQKASLKQRLVILESFVDAKGARTESLFAPGQLTIVDLSDPFIDPGSACALFEIITRLFVRAKMETGKVLVVDEAHKYLSAHRGETGLTKALTALIRQQRHLGMRVVISTQEPTAVPPVLIELCSIAIFHRFSSPAWWEAVARRSVVKLKTGQALVLSPSGLGSVEGKSAKTNRVAQFGRRYLLMKTRKRVTQDGGASIWRWLRDLSLGE